MKIHCRKCGKLMKLYIGEIQRYTANDGSPIRDGFLRCPEKGMLWNPFNRHDEIRGDVDEYGDFYIEIVDRYYGPR